MTRTRMLGSALLAATLTTALAACGSSEADEFADQSVKKIRSDIEKDMGSLKSMTLDGTFSSNGTKTSLELATDTDGNCVGTLGQNGGTADIVSVDGASYLKADEAFWKATAGESASQIVALLDGKWAKLPAGEGGPFAAFCDLDSFLENLNGDNGQDKAKKGDLTDLDGEQALELTSEEDGGTTKAWVAAEGKHYFLKMERKGDDAGSFEFGDFNEPVDAEAPDEDKVFDLSSMG